MQRSVAGFWVVKISVPGIRARGVSSNATIVGFELQMNEISMVGLRGAKRCEDDGRRTKERIR